MATRVKLFSQFPNLRHSGGGARAPGSGTRPPPRGVSLRHHARQLALALGQQPLGTIVGGLEQRRVRPQPAGLEDQRQRLLDMRVAGVLVAEAHVGAGIPLASSEERRAWKGWAKKG